MLPRLPGPHVGANLQHPAWTGPGWYVPCNLGVDEPGPPPDPDPEPAYRGVRTSVGVAWGYQPRGTVRVATGAAWARAQRRARAATVCWALLQRGTVRHGVAVPWGQSARTATPALAVPWAERPRSDARASAGIVWALTTPVHGQDTAVAWRARAERVSAEAVVPYLYTLRRDVAADIAWHTEAGRVVVQAGTPWRIVLPHRRSWWIPWGFSSGLPWIVHPPPKPPKPAPQPGRRVPGRYVGAELGCPVWTGPARYIPANLGIAACYNIRRRRRTYVVNNSVTVVRLPDNAPVQVTSIDIQLDAGSPMHTLSMQVADDASLALLKPGTSGPREVLVTINGYALTFIIEDWTTTRVFPGRQHTVTGRSRTALLAAPYAPERSLVRDQIATAAMLAELELEDTGYTLDWQTIDWTVPAGAWSYAEMTPLDAIVEIAAGCGAVVQSDIEDKVLHVLPRYPARPWDWPETEPDVTVTSDLAVQVSERVANKPKYNEVYVAATAQGVAGFCLRSGEGGGVYAPQFTHPLVNTEAVHQEVGSNILSDRGRQSDWTFAGMPIFPEPVQEGQVGLLRPLQLALVHEGGSSWMGLITRTRISVHREGPDNRALVVTQTVNIERHPEDAD